MNLKIPILEDLYEVAKWRNSVKETLRTSGDTTKEQQNQFYKNVICNENSKHKYFSVYDEDKFIGFTGLTDINTENMNAEISLIVNPKYKKQGYGSKIVNDILNIAFNDLRLCNVYGECYYCNPNIKFWVKIVKKYNGIISILHQRKFYEYKLWDSMYFNINKGGYLDVKNNT